MFACKCGHNISPHLLRNVLPANEQQRIQEPFKNISLLIKVLWPTFFDEGAFVLLFFCEPVGAIAGVVAA